MCNDAISWQDSRESPETGGVTWPGQAGPICLPLPPSLFVPWAGAPASFLPQPVSDIIVRQKMV